MKIKEGQPFVISAATIVGGAVAAAGIGTVASAVGTIGGLYGTYASLQSGKQAAAASQRGEAIRQQQVKDEANQKRLANLRRQVIAFGQTTANTEVAGTEQGGSIGGALSGAYGSFATQRSNINTAEKNSSDLFASNAAYSNAKGNADFYSGLGSFSQSFGNSIDSLANVGTSLFAPKKDYQG